MATSNGQLKRAEQNEIKRLEAKKAELLARIASDSDTSIAQQIADIDEDISDMLSTAGGRQVRSPQAIELRFADVCLGCKVDVSNCDTKIECPLVHSYGITPEDDHVKEAQLHNLKAEAEYKKSQFSLF